MWNDPRYFDVDQVVDTLGVMPADFIRQMFEMQKPAQRLAGQLRVSEQMWNDEFVRSYRAFERWGDETLPLAGEYMRQTTKELSWGNKLFTGELVVGGRDAKLANIRRRFCRSLPNTITSRRATQRNRCSISSVRPTRRKSC